MSVAVTPPIIRGAAARPAYLFHVPPGMRELTDRYRTPVVWPNTRQAHDAVHSDDHGAGRQAAAHLLERGFWRIAYVDSSHGDAELPEKHYSATDRAAGYTEAMMAYGMTTAEPLSIAGYKLDLPIGTHKRPLVTFDIAELTTGWKAQISVPNA